MSDKSIESDPVGELAELFVERYRRGERPALTEYTEKYPEHADRIRKLFPALVMMEELAPAEGESVNGSVAPRGSLPRTKQGERLERVGDYRILREIGRGGMGVVYEAEQVSLGRHVALKVLPFHAAKDLKALVRFRREARAAARLHHSNIVPVYDVGQDHDVCYYAMQFIQGQGLDEISIELARMRRDKILPAAAQASEAASPAEPSVSAMIAQAMLAEFDQPMHPVATAAADSRSSSGGAGDTKLSASPSSAVLACQPDLSSVSESNPRHYYRSVARIGVQVADALVYAHGKGVIHRDIKPSNLLLDTSGTVWVTDFGLAKATASSSPHEAGDPVADLTGIGDIVGTLRYMAPERFRGGSGPESDVYGLGMTLYELLTLKPAFDSPDRLKLIQHVSHSDPVRPRRIDPRIPRDIETIVLKAIEKEPARRYTSASALAEDLRRFLADRPIQARRSAVWERTWRLCRRNPIVASLIASVALLIVFAAAIALAYSVRLARELAKTERAEHAERAAKQDALDKLCQSYLEQAKALASSRNVGQRFDGLRAILAARQLVPEVELSPGRLAELRNAAIACLALPDLRQIRKWDDWPEDRYRHDFDNRGERYTRSEMPGTVTVRRVADDSEIVRFEGLGKHPWARFSKDGQLIAVWSDTGFKVWKLGLGEPEQVIELSGVNCWAIGPDNRHLAVVSADGKLELSDIETAARVRSLGTARANSWPVFSPSGQYVAFHAAGRAVHVVDVESGKLVRELTPGEAEFDFAWHPDGKTLAIGPYPEGIVFWDVETGKKGRVLPHRGGGMRLSFNATGEMLLSHTWWDGGLRLWHSQTGKLLLSGTLGLDIVGFHPTLDGRWLHFSSEPGATLWEINPGNVYRTIAQDSVASGEVTDCAFTQDARLLVIASQRGLALWDVASVTPLAKTPVATDGVVFDPSGQLITSGPAGLLRWPVATAETESRGNRDVQQLQIGPPQSLAALPSSIPRSLRTSRDGRLVAMPHGTDATVIHLDRVGSPISLGPHDDVRFAAVAPDGDLVATGSWLVGIKVWDVQSGKLVADLPVGGLCGVEFSADGRWLATSSGGGRLWRVGNWEQATSLGGVGSAASGLVLAFSPLLQRPDVVPKDRTNEKPLESSILAMAQSTGVVRLIDPETARDLAELTDPYKHRVRTMRFSPDGTKLVISTNDDGGMVHIWDLRLLRAELAALDLDWAWPPLPAAESDHEQRLLAVHVDIGSSLAASPSPEEKARSDIDRYRGAYVANPDNAMACNNLAWVLVTVPEELRRVDEALALAEKAVQLAPQNMLYTNTLGVVYYRAGRYREAIECLESNLERQEDKELAFDLYFLAMSYHHLGDPGRARELLIWSNRWVESRTQEDALTPSQIAELAAFRREAVSLLGK